MLKKSTILSKELLLAQSCDWQRWEEHFTPLFLGRGTREEIEKMKATLLLISKKGEDSPEIFGLLETVRKLEPPQKIYFPTLTDVCGTGGDASRTFNISTISGLVIAGAGGFVAKHGNRAVSSRAGSSDLMEVLGICLDTPFQTMLHALRRYHFGYFHAPFYHPSFAKFQSLRRELGVRTIFNLMGPLVNPFELQFQMIGVSNPGWLFPVAETLKILGRKRAAVFRSVDGLDELSTTASNDILYIDNRAGIKTMHLNPKKLGFPKAKITDYRGGDRNTNREIALGILENRIQGPKQDVVVLSSGFNLWLTGLAASLSEGIERARWAIRTGRANDVLKGLRRITNKKVCCD